MSKIFVCTGVEFRSCVVDQERSYGGTRTAFHLPSNSAYVLPFVIRGSGVRPDEPFDRPVLAHFHRHLSHMPEPGGPNFNLIELQLRPVETVRNQALEQRRVVIERVFEDLLPMKAPPTYKDGWRGWQGWANPGVPMADDPLVVSSHTADGRGFYCYRIWTEDEEA